MMEASCVWNATAPDIVVVYVCMCVCSCARVLRKQQHKRGDASLSPQKKELCFYDKGSRVLCCDGGNICLGSQLLVNTAGTNPEVSR